MWVHQCFGTSLHQDMSISLLFNTSASGHCISTSTSMCVHQWFWTPLHLYISTSLLLNTSTSVQCINTLVHQSSASVHCISTSVHQSITWRECRASSAAANLFASSRVWNQVKLGRLWGKIIEWWITRISSKVSSLHVPVWWGGHDFFPIWQKSFGPSWNLHFKIVLLVKRGCTWLVQWIPNVFAL